MVNTAAAGYIFLCSDATESECVTKGLMGATAENFGHHIDHDTKLFRYNISSRRLIGLWKARQEICARNTCPGSAETC